jgi:hypothetical protein
VLESSWQRAQLEPGPSRIKPKRSIAAARASTTMPKRSMPPWAAEHSGGPSREQLIQKNQALREENTQFWNWLSLAIEFLLVKQHEFSAVALAMRLSLTQIAVLLALLLGAKAA